MAKSKVHSFVVTVRFDKKCTAGFARREVADCIHGNFYTTPRDDSDPEQFWIKGFRPVPTLDQMIVTGVSVISAKGRAALKARAAVI